MRVGFIAVSLLSILSFITPTSTQAHGRHDFKGSEGGIVRAIVTNPAQSATLYAATSDAGVFKSRDGGNHWAPVNRGLDRVDVLALVQDPATPATLVAATRDGLYKSVDGAGHWQHLDASIGSGRVNMLAFDIDTRTLYAGTEQGIWKSGDVGATWSPLAGQPADKNVIALALAHDNQRSLYAGTAQGLFRSRDQGATWVHISKGLAVPAIATFALDPVRPNIVYAGTGDGTYKSEDGGDTWHSITAGQMNVPVTALLIDPRHPDTVYMGTSFVGGLFRSKDGGKSWQRIQGAEFTPAITVLAFRSADTQRLIAGSSFYAGLFISDDGGSNWKTPADRLTLPELESITGTPDGDSVFAAAADGIYQFDSVEQNWKRLGNADVGTPARIIYSKRHGGSLWVCGTKGIAEGQASKKTWLFKKRFTTSTPCIDLAENATSGHLIAATATKLRIGPGAWVTRTPPLANAPIEHVAVDAHSGSLYVLTEHRVLRSDDEGKSWQSFADNPASVLTAIATAAATPTTWLATDATITHRAADGKSMDISDGVFPPGIRAMAASADGSHIYAASGVLGRMFARAQGRGMWISTDLEAGAPEISGLWVDPAHEGVVYASTRNSGVVRSNDHGQTWAAINAGLKTPPAIAGKHMKSGAASAAPARSGYAHVHEREDGRE